MKEILLITTGGTIACTPDINGLAPAMSAEGLISYVPKLCGLCNITSIELMNIDSSNMNLQLIAEIAQTIYDNFDAYDGFVITHGTDTLAYTAAGLSYMMSNLTKPVILTGSQLPIEADDTDAKRNLYDAFCCACEDFSGVYVSFFDKLIVGTCAKKVRTRSFDAFESINHPLAAKIENYRVVKPVQHTQKSQKDGELSAFSIDTKMCPDVLVLKIFPGMRTDIFDFVKDHCRGIVLECYGLGGLPDADGYLLSKIDELNRAGVAVVISTQCTYEGIDLSVYSVGQNLKNRDIIDGGSATTEALTMKLMWALAHYESVQDVKTFLEESD
jgi:L-asparaginase